MSVYSSMDGFSPLESGTVTARVWAADTCAGREQRLLVPVVLMELVMSR